MLTKIAKAAYISTVKVGIEVLSVTTLLRRRNVETMNTIGIIVVAILVVIVVVVTSQWDKEVQIRKIYDKYFLDIASLRREINVKAKTYQQENVELKKQLSAAKNDIKIVEDTYKSKIIELEAEKLKHQKETDKLVHEIIELKSTLNPDEAQENEEQQETEN